jgi:hypothetical protein
MAVTTADHLHVASERKRGFFSRAFERFAEAQSERARAIAKPHLLALDDEELTHLGYDRDEIRRWPSGGPRWL